MSCPRCGFPAASDGSCPRCGVVFAKLRPAGARPAPSATPAPPGHFRPGLALAAAGSLLLALVLLVGRRGPRPAATVRGDTREPRAAPSRPADVPDLPTLPPPSSPTALDPPLSTGARGGDSHAAQDLVRRLNAGAAMGSSDVAIADRLLAAHGGEAGVRPLAAAVYSRLAGQEHAARRLPEATAFARRAAALDGRQVASWLLLAQLELEGGRWPEAEAAARAALELDANSDTARKLLGYALVRLDRGPEAALALEAGLRQRPDPGAQALLDRVRQGLRTESGMTAQQLAHFTVRYDGEAHEEVGREILGALDRHYATLARAFDHEPAAPVPVILFTRQAYYDASGAPAWSGGAYDTLDGRVRIPIGGLTRSLTPDIDRTLAHELTHAFVADLSRGAAPREVHEGLAQYMEGRRLLDDLDGVGLRALADGRTGGYRAFYLLALGHVEHLAAERGLGGLKDLLRAMARTGSADAAFREVYGRTAAESMEDFRRRLRQQHGS